MPELDKRLLVMHHADNVATALRPLAPDERIILATASGPRELAVRDHIAFGHKIAAIDIPSGTPVIKGRESIGTATMSIARGQHVHVHNVASRRGRGDLKAAERGT